jgi:uncharacterized cupin superfamily protein
MLGRCAGRQLVCPIPRLILTLDDGREFKFEQGDSLVLPEGYVRYWDMPEKYRELVVIKTK